MIQEWLAEMPLARFLEDRYGRAPYCRPLSGRPFVGLVNWKVIEGLFTGRADQDVLVTRHGRLFPELDPRTFGAAKGLFDSGHSLVLRRVERWDPVFAAVATSFSDDMGAPASVQIYVTPRGAQTFGWHYDVEEVFILQTLGSKEYFLRENTVNPTPSLDTLPKDMEFERETSPMLGSTLLAGDWLYIPSGWWHAAWAVEDSLSLSVGVWPRREALRLRSRFVERRPSA